MPSTYAHYRFGKRVLERLDGDARRIAERHRALFDIGLHGPDVLFHCRAFTRNPVNRLGHEVHAWTGRRFFAQALPAAVSDESRAYLYGFLCHFALDSTCHPFVDRFVRESGVSHCEIETEFDNMLLRRDGQDPLKFFTASHIQPSAGNAHVIAPFYEGITEQQTQEALKGMITVHRLLQASNPVKRWVVLTGMKVVGKYEGMHGLVANPKPNPRCADSNRQLEELYAKALPLAERLILEYVAQLDSAEPLDKAYDHTFGEF